MFSSMSTLFGCKSNGIFHARTPHKLLAPLGEKQETILCLWMSGYFLVKKNIKLLAVTKKKLKEILNKVMTNNLYLGNLFHQCSSPPYTRKENWLHFITKIIRNTILSPYYTAGAAIPFVRNIQRSISIPALNSHTDFHLV